MIIHLLEAFAGYNPRMPKIERHAPGTFRWVELRFSAVADPQGAAFSLFEPAR